jgi:uncharacterized protein YbaR (Trm112 family)
MNPKYLEVLACPSCKGPLIYDEKQSMLVCTFEKLGFPIKDGIMMLELSHAIDLSGAAASTAAV